MQDATARPPRETGDLAAVLGSGRRRVRVRRAGIVGGTALAAAGTVAVASLSWLNPAPADLAAAGVPRAAGPVIGLGEARPAIEGQDYRVLASYTNENLDADNGQYFDGVTDDGLILFRDGPRAEQLWPRYALMDPASGHKDWLPGLDIGQAQLWPLDLGRERLVLMGLSGGGMRSDVTAHVFDRATRQWSTVQWSGLPKVEGPVGTMGPDDRLYVRVPATQGEPPEGGWPMGPDGEADDADAEGDTYHLWSASLTDPTDVRDEGLTVGSVDFTDDSMVWTDSTGGDAGMVHVRDLSTGEEHSFDPRLGEKCNLLGFSAGGEHLAMSQYCGTYEGGVRDDRVQVMTTDGELVTTIQDSGADGGRLDDAGDFLTVVGYDRGAAGTYAYDIEDEELLRISEGHAPWSAGGGPTPGDLFMWSTPTGRKVPMFGHSGATFWLGEIIR